jgi:transposase-like protein
MRKARQFSKEFKRQCVEEMISGMATPAVLSRRYAIAIPVITRWRKDYAAGKLNCNASSEQGLQDKICHLEQIVGRLTAENDLLKKALQYALSQKEQNASLSALTGMPLGVSRGGAK